MKLKWNRSDEGYTDSKCERFSITPLYYGTTYIQGYQLHDNIKTHTNTHDTQSDAKYEAQRVVDAEEKK